MKTRNTIWAAGLLALAISPVLGEETKKAVATPQQNPFANVTVSAYRLDREVTKKTVPTPPQNHFANVTVSVYRLDREVTKNFDEWLAGIVKSGSGQKETEVVIRAIHTLWIPEGKAELIAQPKLAAPIGSWSSLGMVREMRYPTEYDPATVPKSLEDQAKILTGEAKKPIPTNESNVLIPPAPKKFEDRDIGLAMKVSPRFGKGGALSVSVEVERSALQGFVDFGTPIGMDKPGVLRKNAKPFTLLDNRLAMPVFLKEKQTFEALSGGKRFLLLPGEGATDSAERAIDPEFGQEFSEAELPPLLLVVHATKLESNLKTLVSDGAETEPAETRSWTLSANARSGFSVSQKEPNEETAKVLCNRFAELGISTSAVSLSPDWKLKATANPAMIKRLDALVARYEKNQHIFVTSKFIESSEPLEDLTDLVMTDEEFQKTIRELNQKRGIDMLSAPSILMRPFQEGKMEVMREFIFPVEYDPPKILIDNKEKVEEGAFPVTPATPREFKTRNTGVELAIFPRVFEDGSIELTLEPKVLEFLGFQNFGQSLFVLDKGPLGKTRRVCISDNRIEMPVFERRDIKTRIRIPDGATVAIGGLVKTEVQSVEDKVPLLGDLPLIGRVARSKGEITVHRHLYVFVTAKRIDPAGISLSEQND